MPDQLLKEDLDEAISRAKQMGRFEIADYLSLRASNDEIRQAAVDWLFGTVIEIVTAFNSHGASIRIERMDGIRVKYGNYRLSGEQIELRQGLRCLTLEAGWTRTTNDGFMRGGSLAFSRISHFGMVKETEELVLHKFDGKPQWFSIRDEKLLVSFNAASLRRHFELFLG